MTGLFIHQTRSHMGPGRQYLARRRPGPKMDREKLNAFAEALAETGVIAEASRAVGISRQRGGQFLSRLRAELGWQAQ